MAPFQQESDGHKAGLGVYSTGKALGRGRGWLGWLRGQPSRRLVATFPVPAAITPQAILQRGGLLAELAGAGALDEPTTVMLHLVVERLRGASSPLAPWLATLPDSFDTPLFYTSRDLQELKVRYTA